MRFGRLGFEASTDLRVWGVGIIGGVVDEEVAVALVIGPWTLAVTWSRGL